MEDKTVLDEVKVLRTDVEKVTERHKTPWLIKWTLHTVEVPEQSREHVARQLSKAIVPKHKGSWYADFKNKETHYIIFRDKVFKVDRRSKEEYDQVNKYGEALGIPPYQLDFSPQID